MPWTALPFGDARIEILRKHLQVLETPKVRRRRVGKHVAPFCMSTVVHTSCLTPAQGIMVAPDGTVLNRQVIKSLLLDKRGDKFPWESKPEPSCLCIG